MQAGLDPLWSVRHELSEPLPLTPWCREVKDESSTASTGEDFSFRQAWRSLGLASSSLGHPSLSLHFRRGLRGAGGRAGGAWRSHSCGIVEESGREVIEWSWVRCHRNLASWKGHSYLVTDGWGYTLQWWFDHILCQSMFIIRVAIICIYFSLPNTSYSFKISNMCWFCKWYPQKMWFFMPNSFFFRLTFILVRCENCHNLMITF